VGAVVCEDGYPYTNNFYEGVMMADETMPKVNAEFGAMPELEFPAPTAPAGLKALEVIEGDGPVVRKGDTVTVNYHGVVWGSEKPFDSSFNRHEPASFGIGVGQVIKGWDQTVVGHNVGSRLLLSIPPEYGYGSRGIPQAGIGGGDTLVFVVDIISTR
jgi:peptidylprolyl isomerase